MIKCPCIDCVCMPICRHKTYYDLHQDCKLISNYLEGVILFTPDNWDYGSPTVFESLKQLLRPTKWDTTKSGNVDIFVH